MRYTQHCTIDPKCENDPPAIAAQHAAMVECAILSNEIDKAHAAVDRAFAMMAAHATDRLSWDDDLSLILGNRIVTILNGDGIKTIGDLCVHSRNSLAQIHQIRFRSIDLIERALQRHGFALQKSTKAEASA